MIICDESAAWGCPRVGSGSLIKIQSNGCQSIAGVRPNLTISRSFGGTIARHTAAGHVVGLCDLSAGELGSNGTPEERWRIDQPRASRRRVRENLRWPDGVQPSATFVRSAVDLIRRHRPRAIAIPLLGRSTS
jgi:hypothetical protein